MRPSIVQKMKTQIDTISKIASASEEAGIPENITFHKDPTPHNTIINPAAQ
ncbi:MAG: hypothetical protein ABII94_01350 [Patescibacteria group bacterium]